MSYTRASATSHLAVQFATLATETGQVTTDTSAGFGPAIDQALRKIGGTAEADLATATVADATVPAFLALAEYYALTRFARALATRVDFGVPTVEADRPRIFAHIDRLIKLAREECAAQGYPVDGSESWSFARLQLDYIEPEPV